MAGKLGTSVLVKPYWSRQTRMETNFWGEGSRVERDQSRLRRSGRRIVRGES